jgi:hypothetical protein
MRMLPCDITGINGIVDMNLDVKQHGLESHLLLSLLWSLYVVFLTA